MTQYPYEDWESPRAQKSFVYTIDANKKSIKEILKADWGDLVKYLPNDQGPFTAFRSLERDGKGQYIQLLLGEGWDSDLSADIRQLKFRFPEIGSPVYHGHPDLNNFEVLRMDSGEEIPINLLDWEAIPGFHVELFKTYKNLTRENVFSLKIYMQNINDGRQVVTSWCW